MSLNSINTNVAAYYAQSNIGKASSMASSSIARLSSGNRIVRASDDVAAMSAGTSLRTNVTTLKMALVNTSQGSSLLQVADGALSQVTDILQRQKAISVQAGSGSLTSQERSFLNQEFQNLSKEIDRLVDNTNFNGVTLLDGSLSEKVDATQVDTAATSATASITWSTTPVAAETVILNGVTFTAVAATATPTALQFALGSSTAETIDNLVTQLNSLDLTAVNAGTVTQAQYDAISQATYSRSGNSLIITADRGGAQGEAYRISGASTAIRGSGTGVASISGAGASSTINLLQGVPRITATSVTASVVGTTIAAPFAAGVLTGQIGALAAQTLATVAAGDTLQTIVDKVNARTSITGFTAGITGHSGAYNIQFEHNDVDLQAGGAFDVTLGGAAIAGFGAVTLTTGTVTTNNLIYTLGASDDLGIGAGDTVGRGVTGDDIITDQNQQKAAVSIIFPEIADGDLLSSTNFGGATAIDIRIANGTSGAIQFWFSQDGGGPTEASVGSTLTETLDNMVSTINSYYGSQASNYMLDQIHARRDGNNIVLETNDYTTSAVNYAAGATLAVTQATAVTGGSVTNSGNLNNGVNGGVSTSGVTNKDFIGTIQGFTSTYSGTTDRVSLSVTVGDHTYTASNVDTTPSTNTTVRFSSDSGGFFDVQMAASQGQTVSSQSGADAIATRFNAAFSSLTFYQNHEISSYSGNAPILTDGVVTGSLIGTSVSLQDTDFSSITIDKIRVTAPSGSNENGKITFTINGEDYTTASNVGSQLGANTDIKLVSDSDADKFLIIHTGDAAIEFDTAAKAASFQSALEAAFGVGDGSAELKFQVGVTTEDTLSVGVSNISTSKLFGGASLDVLTAESAATASDLIDEAIDIVTTVRAEVGALMSRFDFASANVESSIQNQDAARGTLLDTDVAAESTRFSTAQVQLQAGIAVLAQANQLPQNLLKLIG